ncbi:MAG: hypothetical protein ACR652_09645 [Methylocystis sp.]|uniref:hypothetical protein n=1 Tax=Methylocystis sp. TaxID=1911079 RepID=UPI003DA36EFA
MLKADRSRIEGRSRVRFVGVVRIRAPRGFSDAIREAAGAAHVSQSEFIRSALVEKLGVCSGVLPAMNSSAAIRGGVREQLASPNPMQSMMMANSLGAAQSQANTQAAQQQQKMNMVNQSTPYGSLNYVADPSFPGGYRATQTLTPEMQALLGSNTQMAQGSSNIGNELLANSGCAMSKPLDLSYDVNAQRIAELARTFGSPCPL